MKRSVNTDDLKISFGGHSDKGLKDENQDAFALKINRGMALELKGHLAVIADGVSSANCATKASQMSVCHFIEEYLATPDSWSVNKAAQTVIASLNDWLYSRQLVNTPQGQLEEWYSTFSALILKGNQAHIFHVGDCQIAKINDDGYQVLTQEHASPAGMLNRALGASNHLKIDVIKTELAANDLFILSCDGVYQFVKNKQIIEIISQQPDLEQASLQITQLAKSQGSKDNLTCLLVKIEQVPAQAFEQLINSRKQQVIAPPLNIGDKLDHYTVVENLQLSTRSHVYLAKDNQSDVLVVLKVPSPNFTDDSHYLNNFIKEGWLGQKINHPAVMKIEQPLSNGRFLYHVCEYVQGQTLEQWCKDHPLPTLTQVRDITVQVVQALRILQRHDVVHCDIKSDNFMFDGHNRIKLIDFGSCQVGAISDSMTMQIDGLPAGTLNFTAPELFLGQRHSQQSDLFSLAVMIYQMLCARLPFKEIERPEQAPKKTNLWRYIPITTYRDDLPTWLDVVLSKALSPSPSNRYQSYSEFVTALNNSSLLREQHPSKLPLIERDPVKFWQGISLILFLLLIGVILS